MKFLKYGYGRATDQLCIEIRANRISRDEAIKALKKSSEGKVPWKFIPDFLDYLNISEEDFFDNLDLFTNKRLFATDADGKLIKDNSGNLQALYRPS